MPAFLLFLGNKNNQYVAELEESIQQPLMYCVYGHVAIPLCVSLQEKLHLIIVTSQLAWLKYSFQ